MKKVVWGVISTAKIGRERVLPGMQKSELLEIRAIASRDEATARAAAYALGIPRGLRLLRGAARRSRDRGDLQPAAQPPARAADAAGGGGRQARAVREADRAHRRRGDGAARRARRRCSSRKPSWSASTRSGCARASIVREGRIGELRAVQMFFGYNNRRPGQHPQQGRHRRRRALRHRLLRRRRGPLLLRGASRRARSRWSTATRRSAPTASPAAWSTSAAGGSLDFTVSTQIAPLPADPALRHEGPDRDPDSGQRAAGRGDAHPDRRLPSLDGAGIRAEELPASDQYQLQGEAFSRAVRGEIALPYGIEDAIANMRVIDALFRSEKSGAWEAVAAP